ncbi:hypothetical protein M404DRAFT_514344 [Pisolithus tinctorius Marx 270]|uniref:Uncharacterized protein n=1 Tax=Pisolithus tinctorius Marx 270 TaxID=870435 RepID=A0A0C3PD52_PISTI|nr:hypothetical protein M404DRAFT_514344 [Pisolithus tinctorius Marx 270]
MAHTDVGTEGFDGQQNSQHLFLLVSPDSQLKHGAPSKYHCANRWGRPNWSSEHLVSCSPWVQGFRHCGCCRQGGQQFPCHCCPFRHLGSRCPVRNLTVHSR